MQGIFYKASKLVVTDMEIINTVANFLAQCNWRYSSLFYYNYNR